MFRAALLLTLLAGSAFAAPLSLEGVPVLPVRDTDLCPASETMALVMSLRDTAINQAVSYSMAGHCQMAFSAETLRSMQGDSAAVSYRLLAHYAGGMIVVASVSQAAPFAGAGIQTVHTVWFATEKDFAPVAH